MKADRMVIDDFEFLGFLVEHCGPGAAIMLETPLDVLHRYGRNGVEFGALAKLEGAALGVLGEIETLGECRMVVFLLAKFFYQAVMQCHQEIVRGRGAVMLLRLEPAGGDIGVPSQHYLPFGYYGCSPGSADEGHSERSRRDRRVRQHRAAGQRHSSHNALL